MTQDDVHGLCVRLAEDVYGKLLTMAEASVTYTVRIAAIAAAFEAALWEREERIRVLVEALQPFADLTNSEDDEPGAYEAPFKAWVTNEMVLKARAALASLVLSAKIRLDILAHGDYKQ